MRSPHGLRARLSQLREQFAGDGGFAFVEHAGLDQGDGELRREMRRCMGDARAMQGNGDARGVRRGGSEVRGDARRYNGDMRQRRYKCNCYCKMQNAVLT